MFRRPPRIDLDFTWLGRRLKVEPPQLKQAQWPNRTAFAVIGPSKSAGTPSLQRPGYCSGYRRPASELLLSAVVLQLRWTSATAYRWAIIGSDLMIFRS